MVAKSTGLALGKCGFNPWLRTIPWRRKWQPTPVFLSGESHGQRSLAGCNPWGHKESNTTEHTHAHTCTILCLQNVLSCLTAQDAIKYKLEMIGVLNMALVERKKVKCDLGQSHHFSDPQVPQPQNTLQMLKDHTGE